MRYKLVGIILLLLIATPLYAQRPIAVDTLPPTPTAVKTAEMFEVTYRIRYLDLAQWNKEVVLFSDEAAVEKQVSLSDSLRVVNVERKDLIRKDGEYWQDFVLFLRIIDKSKGAKKISKIKFDWALKEIGEEDDSLKAEEPLESEEVNINYITTVTEDPYLDIRDGLKLGNFFARAWWLRFIIPMALSAFFLAGWILLLIKLRRTPRQPKTSDIARDENIPDKIAADMFVWEYDAPSFGRARKALAAAVKDYKKLFAFQQKYGDEQLLAVERDLCKKIYILLASALPDVNPGDTPRQIREYAKSKVESGELRDAYFGLAVKLVDYWNDSEKEQPEQFRGGRVLPQLEELSGLLGKTRWYNRLFTVKRR